VFAFCKAADSHSSRTLASLKNYNSKIEQFNFVLKNKLYINVINLWSVVTRDNSVVLDPDIMIFNMGTFTDINL